MELVFADLNSFFIREVALRFRNIENVRAVCEDVTGIRQNNTAFVAPCNMLLNMSAGIDNAYETDMFPGIQTTGLIKLRSLNSRTALGRPILPIGSAMLVPATPETHTYLLFAPTMFSSQDVSQTSNAYHAFMAVLCVMRKAESPHIRTIVCPGLCVGNGNMEPRVAAEQIHQAFCDFYDGVRVPCQVSFFEDRSVFMSNANSAEEQPNLYENTEIKQIEISEVLYR
jgi:O-acetyl-ADP-ribose deacetylase (regulator of RNase III)